MVSSLLVDFDNPVHNWYVSTFDLEHKLLPSLEGLVLVVSEEEKVSTIEDWLHATTKTQQRGEEVGEGGGTQVKMACLWQACSNLVYKVV